MTILALDMGVDYPDIVFVLHMGMPHSMINYTQESRHARCDGEVVDSIVLVKEKEKEREAEQSSNNL